MNRQGLSELLQHVTQDVALNRADLDGEMGRQASRFFFYGRPYAVAIRDAKLAKLAVEEIEATIYEELHQETAKVTERAHDARCRLDTRWKSAMRTLIFAEEAVDALEKMCKALDHKRDMLVNITANRRSELQSDIRTSHKGGTQRRV